MPRFLQLKASASDMCTGLTGTSLSHPLRQQMLLPVSSKDNILGVEHNNFIWHGRLEDSVA